MISEERKHIFENEEGRYITSRRMRVMLGLQKIVRWSGLLVVLCENEQVCKASGIHLQMSDMGPECGQIGAHTDLVGAMRRTVRAASLEDGCPLTSSIYSVPILERLNMPVK